MKKFALTLTLLCLPFTIFADINKAQRQFNEQRFGDTLESIDAILATQAKHQQALFLKAMTLQRIGRIDDAIAAYQVLNREYPQSPEPYNNLAVLYAQQGKHKQARDTLLRALNAHPSYATAYKNLNDIYSRMASNAYSKALALNNKKGAKQIKLALINKIEVPAAENTDNKLPLAKNPVTAQVSTAIKVPTAAAQDSAEKELIIDTIMGWSNAWAAQNSDAYLAYYAASFNPPNGFTRLRWENDRRIRLRKPSFIRVSIQSPKVVLLSENSARLTFKQNYQSNRFRDAVIKTLLLKKISGSWQIVEEYTPS